MIQKIIDAISIAINTEFGDGYEIYTESVEQDLLEPCFSILCLNPTIEQYLGNKYYRTNQFSVQYFPSTGEKNAECFSVHERLSHCLEYITVDGNLSRGTKMNGRPVDGVLSFFVNYDMFVYKVATPEDEMETVELNSDVKG